MKNKIDLYKILYEICEDKLVYEKDINLEIVKKLASVLEKEGAIYSSKVMLYCTKCKNATRISNKILEDGTKVRVCKKCGETF